MTATSSVPSPSPLSRLPGGNSGTATVPLSVAAGTNPCAPVTADLDGDGRPDLVVALAGVPAISVLAGTGSGFAAATRVAIGSGGTALVVDDFTGDGEPDVLVAGSDGRLYCLPAQCPPMQPATLAFTPATFADTAAALHPGEW